MKQRINRPELYLYSALAVLVACVVSVTLYPAFKPPQTLAEHTFLIQFDRGVERYTGRLVNGEDYLKIITTAQTTTDSLGNLVQIPSRTVLLPKLKVGRIVWETK